MSISTEVILDLTYSALSKSNSQPLLFVFVVRVMSASIIYVNAEQWIEPEITRCTQRVLYVT